MRDGLARSSSTWPPANGRGGGHVEPLCRDVYGQSEMVEDSLNHPRVLDEREQMKPQRSDSDASS
jgi:hypothetical protein